MTTFPRHLRNNHDATDGALIRFNGMAYALEIVADEIPPNEPKSCRHWQAFYALLNNLVDQHDTIMRLREIEWVGIGGEPGGLREFTAAEVARARGQSAPEAMIEIPVAGLDSAATGRLE